MKCDVFNIWETYRNDLKNYIRKRVFDENDADDIMQSVLIKITSYCETKNDVKYIKAWIYRITQNMIIDFYKKSKRTTYTELEHIYLPVLKDFDENIYIWLHAFIDNLPTEYSVPLRLSDIDGKPHKKIAEQLRLIFPSTSARIQRERNKIIEELDECGFVEFSVGQSLVITITRPVCLL